MNRHKDEDPKQTVERIRGILDTLDLHPEGEVTDFAGRFYSLRIADRITHTGSNGKGATADLARASAYGEYMERLENGMFVAPYLMSREWQTLEGLFSWPEARCVSFDEVCASHPAIMQELVSNYMPHNTIEPDAARKSADEALSFWRESLKGQVTLLPYYCVGTRSCVELPDSLIALCCTSNGLCSGNTPAEALVEGMSELCERYSKSKILYGQLCPPRIPESFIETHCPDQAEMLHTIKERNPELSIIVMDASLGLGLPTICMLFINQERGSVRVKFGAHPSLAIAMERCMTEHYQGYGHAKGQDAAREEHMDMYTAWDSWSRSTLRSVVVTAPMTSSDTGLIPNRMLLNKPDWEFEPWGLDDDFTNGQAACNLVALLRRIGGEVYIRDNGFLGVPAYRVYVPHVSHLVSFVGPRITDSLKTGMQVACALSAYEEGDMRLAADFLKMSGTRKDRCAAQELLCRAEGIAEEERDILLEEYFGKGAAAYAKTVWRADDARSALSAFNRRCKLFKDPAGIKKSQKSELMGALAALADRVKERKAANPIDQMRLDALFAPADCAMQADCAI